MFPWMSKAASYPSRRSARTAWRASRQVAGLPAFPFQSRMGSGTTLAIPGFPARISAKEASPAQWTSAAGAARRLFTLS